MIVKLLSVLLLDSGSEMEETTGDDSENHPTLNCFYFCQASWFCVAVNRNKSGKELSVDFQNVFVFI